MTSVIPLKEPIARPILRWVGGKQYLVQHLLRVLPPFTATARYFEPFLGAGALFFALAPPRATVGDANPALIDAYTRLRNQTSDVIRNLLAFASRDSESFYYRVRDRFNLARPSAQRAACFLYLNRTCFNGVYRVNRKGHFNVPYGYKAPALFPDKEHLRKVAGVLRRATLCCSSYAETLRTAKKGDVVYLDPPYPPLNGTSFFTHYTKDRFTDTDQEALASVVRHLDARGCHIIMTNADTGLIRDLYRDYIHKRLSVIRWVTSDKRKHRVRELVITNF